MKNRRVKDFYFDGLPGLCRPKGTMAHTTHSARIIGPVHYCGAEGNQSLIPLGPCAVEQLDSHSVDIFWGESGEKSAALTIETLKAAEACGHLVLLD